MHVLTPEEIAEHIHEEFTAYSQMSLEDQKKRLAEMIQEYADWYRFSNVKVRDWIPGGLVP